MIILCRVVGCQESWVCVCCVRVWPERLGLVTFLLLLWPEGERVVACTCTRVCMCLAPSQDKASSSKDNVICIVDARENMHKATCEGGEVRASVRTPSQCSQTLCEQHCCSRPRVVTLGSNAPKATICSSLTSRVCTCVRVRADAVQPRPSVPGPACEGEDHYQRKRLVWRVLLRHGGCKLGTRCDFDCGCLSDCGGSFVVRV